MSSVHKPDTNNLRINTKINKILKIWIIYFSLLLLPLWFHFLIRCSKKKPQNNFLSFVVWGNFEFILTILLSVRTLWCILVCCAYKCPQNSKYFVDKINITCDTTWLTFPRLKKKTFRLLKFEINPTISAFFFFTFHNLKWFFVLTKKKNKKCLKLLNWNLYTLSLDAHNERQQITN